MGMRSFNRHPSIWWVIAVFALVSHLAPPVIPRISAASSTLMGQVLALLAELAKAAGLL